MHCLPSPFIFLLPYPRPFSLHVRFNGWYPVSEIGRDLPDKQRNNLATAVGIACTTKLDLWMDDAQLQMHRVILHSFAKGSVSLVDHHTASNFFVDFMEDEADWF